MRRLKRSFTAVWHKQRVRKVIIAALCLGMVAIVLLQLISPASAAVTVGTSTAFGGSATQRSGQRKTWYDGTRYWASYYDGSSAVFYYSTNGTSWTQDSSATLATSDFSIEADQSNAFIAYVNGNNIEARKAASYPGTGFSWGSATVIETNTNGDNGPTLTRDSNNKIFVLWHHTSAATNDVYFANSTVANSIASFNTATNIAGAVTNFSNEAPIAAMSNGHMFAKWDNGTLLQGLYYNGSSWEATPSEPIASVTSNASYSQMIGSGSEAYMSYVNSSGNTLLRKYEDSSGASSTAIGSSLGAIAAGTGRNVVRDSSGNIYVAITAGSTGKIYKSTDNGSTFSEVDSAHHPTISGSSPLALAIDSSNNLHLAYYSSTTNVNYVKITADLYGTPESLGGGSTIGTTSVDIAVDSNNVPHVVWTGHVGVGGNGLVQYFNRVAGSWSSVTLVSTAGANYFGGSLSFSSSNVPEISYIDMTNADLHAAVGNANNATTFTDVPVDTTVNATAGQQGSSIGVDASGNTWVAYTDATGTNQINLVKHNSGDAWSTWQLAVTNAKTGSEPSLAIAGNMLYVLYKNSTGAIAQDIYNEDTATWATEVVVQSGTTLQNAHVRWATNADYQNAPLDLLYSDGTNIQYNQTGVWRAPVTLDSNSGNAYTSLSRDSSTNNLYVTWERSNVIYYKKCASPYLAANCDASATTKYTGGTTVQWLSSAASIGSGACSSVPLIWTEGTSSPYNVKYDTIPLNCPPVAPTLSSPSAGQTSLSLTPQFQLKTTDADSDYLKYQINVCNDSACSSIKHSICQVNSGTGAPSCGTVGQTGWSGQDQVQTCTVSVTCTAYTGNSVLASSTTATYTYQFADLSYCTQYWWEGYAVDPGGTNTWSSVSGIQSFTTNCPPAAPTLTKPVSGETGVNTTPEFHLYSTDLAGDYVTYEIDIYDSTCTTPITGSPFDENVSQTGWSSQSANSGAAYTSGQTAIYKLQTTLANNVQYCWKARAKDPGGTNTFGSFSGTQLFTTIGATKPQINIGGGTSIYSGTTVGG